MIAQKWHMGVGDATNPLCRRNQVGSLSDT